MHNTSVEVAEAAQRKEQQALLWNNKKHAYTVQCGVKSGLRSSMSAICSFIDASSSWKLFCEHISSVSMLELVS